jgi:carboxyl-terminal processing protease
VFVVRRRRSLTPCSPLLLPVCLVAGVWLGGHPRNLPGFARDALVDDSRGRVYDEALDAIADNYYRRVDKDELLDERLERGRQVARRPLLGLLRPEAYTEFEEATRGIRGRRG